jgi:hypothetical protein
VRVVSTGEREEYARRRTLQYSATLLPREASTEEGRSGGIEEGAVVCRVEGVWVCICVASSLGFSVVETVEDKR